MNAIHLSLLVFASIVVSVGHAATVDVIGPENRFPLSGKEADWIDGDFVIRNDEIVAVIARPGELRDANMTVRGVGACIIDLTRVDAPSDQLSCFYPGAGRFQFYDDTLVEQGTLEGGGVFWRCKSSSSLADGQDSISTIEYQLRDGESFLTVITTIKGQDIGRYQAVDGVRADRTFQFGSLPQTAIAYCEDEAFGQTYGIQSVPGNAAGEWSSGRMRELTHPVGSFVLKKADDGTNSLTWTTRIYPAGSPADLKGLSLAGAPQTIRVTGAVGDQPRIKLSVIEGDLGGLKLPAKWSVDESGVSIIHLPSGTYKLRAEAIGHEATEVSLSVTEQPSETSIVLGAASRIVGKFTDERGGEIPCKVTIYGAVSADGTKTDNPTFGLDSASGSVGNCVYSADGTFTRSIPPGTYDVLVSYGPEYDVIEFTVVVEKGSETSLQGKLKRVVDTTGWVSAELHSHSSPSGDNTSEQLGRVENLLCEHLEFAPCTEHQRIESYDDQLEILRAANRMTTCSGMELTGKLLPINHQNAFPLKYDPFAQDGGGPRVDDDPVVQIARLAMWEDSSPKVVQTNHPNMRQMLHDRDLDGKEDGGFSKMLDFMDIIEVHPIEEIFLSDEEVAAKKNPDSGRMRPWMGLFKDGRRIPGVVNTDAHYNWHGSGWLRNWVRSSTDEPSKISVTEMVDHLENGQIVMSTGPFMTVQLHHPDLATPAMIGDEVTIGNVPADLAVKIQCANWLDVNRVEVFVNGEMKPELSRTRTANPDDFADGVVKFDERLQVELPPGDSFIIVAAIGENLTLGRVMGEEFGKKPPVVVSNPIFVHTK